MKNFKLICSRRGWGKDFRSALAALGSPRVKLPVDIQWGFAFYLPNSAHLRRRSAAVKPEQSGTTCTLHSAGFCVCDSCLNDCPKPQYPFVVGA